jgi:hypothetical protein
MFLRTSAVIGRGVLVRCDERFGRRASSYVRDLQIEEEQSPPVRIAAELSMASEA